VRKESGSIVAEDLRILTHEGSVEEPQPPPVDRVAADIRDAAWALALEVVQEGLRDDRIPSLERLGREGQLGDVPTFIVELAKELADPQPSRLRRGGALAARVRDHARMREELGFAPRDIVTEFLLLRRVLWRFVARRMTSLDTGDVFLLERRLNDTIDRLVTECVVAYFDRATLELAEQARRDALTHLLNHQAFTDGVDAELERARRYGSELALVGLDVDSFKAINDTHGHPEGDRVLREFAALLRREVRGSDLAGRLGGDEFAVLLIEGRAGTADAFLERLRAAVEQTGLGFTFSAGCAEYPRDAADADSLFRVADARLYESKARR
jgi:diguanylate cyclase (GGDEF)-like protein